MASSSPSTTAPTTSSSATVDVITRRSCTRCSRRMSSLQFDKHTLCLSCREVTCSMDLRCVECMAWSTVEMADYLRHRKSLVCSDRILTCRINSICSPAKVGLVVIDLITSPVVSWRGWETPPPPTAPRLSCHSLLNHRRVKTSLSVWWPAVRRLLRLCLRLVDVTGFHWTFL